LGADHRNDVITNIVALAAAFIASRFRVVGFLDPVGAILLSIYIVVNWYHNGKEQLQFIIGKTAPPEFVSQVVYLAAHADKNIETVDTVLAYHYGVKFLVECHIGLKKDMELKEAHDIGEKLELEIEKLDFVEKCFVHLDYEWTHRPEYYRYYKKVDKDKDKDKDGSPTITLRDSIRGSVRLLKKRKGHEDDIKDKTQAPPLQQILLKDFQQKE